MDVVIVSLMLTSDSYLLTLDKGYTYNFNTLTANYEYSRSNTDNLPLPVQIQLSEKLKTFYRFFIAFSECALNFEHFEEKK